jgi:signal transduction histidine kinase
MRELTGILSLIAVAAFDIVSSPADPAVRIPLIVLHLLFFACFVGFDLLNSPRVKPINGHVALCIFAFLTLLLFALGSNPTTLIVLFFVQSAFAHETLPEFPANMWVLAYGVASMIVFGLLTDTPVMGAFIGLGCLGGYAFVGGASRNRRAAEAARAESQRLLQELQTAHDQLKLHAHEAEVLAAAEERNRVARELHDTLGHRLTVAAVQLEGAQKLIGRDDNKASQMVGIVRNQVLDGLNELRQTVATLRTPIEADLALPAAINLLAKQYATATGLQLHVEISEELQPYLEQLSRASSHTLFRAAQEGLTNVHKHANATTAWIVLEFVQYEAPAVRLTIHDNGRGLNGTSAPSGYGLAGLAERAAQVHGSMQLYPSPHGGSALSVTVPTGQSVPTPITEPV